MDIAVLALVADYLIWFVVLLAKRYRAVAVRGLAPRERLRALSLDTLLLPVILLGINFSGQDVSLVPLFLPGLALALWTFAPGYVRSKVAPLTLVYLGLYGFTVVRDFARSAEFSWVTRYGFAGGGSGWVYAQLALVQAFAFLTVGLWLTWRRTAPDSRLSRKLLRQPAGAHGAGGGPRWGLLLLVVYGLLVELNGRTMWLGSAWWNEGVTITVGLAAVVLALWLPTVAADLALAGLTLFGIYGIALALFWPSDIPLPWPYTWEVRYGAVWVDSRSTAVLAGVQGLAPVAFGLWLLPRALDPWTRSLLRSTADAELAGRVQRRRWPTP